MFLFRFSELSNVVHFPIIGKHILEMHMKIIIVWSWYRYGVKLELFYIHGKIKTCKSEHGEISHMYGCKCFCNCMKFLLAIIKILRKFLLNGV